MTTKPPAKKKVTKEEVKELQDNTSDFGSKIFTPFAAVITTAIFYYTGWVYIAHWYSYYGIDASQINISLQLILLHGIPGIFVLVIAGLIAIGETIIFKRLFEKSSINSSDLPTIVFIAYVLAVVALIPLILVSLELNGNKIPPEALLSILLILLCAIVYATINAIFTILAFFSGKTIYFSAWGIPIVMPRMLAWVVSLLIMVREAIKNKDVKRIIKIYSLPPKPEILAEMAAKQEEFMKQAEIRGSDFGETISRIRQVSIGALLLFYFIVSISTSSILGEWDAARGVRLMVGNWKIPEIVLFSTQKIPALSNFEKATNEGFQYSPLGLLSSDDNVYYLVDWKTTQYYQQKPHLYIVPRNSDLILNFIASPVVYPTATPLPLPTKTLTPTLTPVPTVIFTITPTP